MGKHALTILVALTLILVPIEAETVHMAIVQIEPFSMEDAQDHTPCGVSVDYWRSYVAPRMGVALDVIGPVPLARAHKMLETGEIDVISQLVWTRARQDLFLYPETDLMEITPGLVVVENSPLRQIQTQKDLSGKKIGFINNSYIPPFLIDKTITLDLIPFENYREMNLKKLFVNRLDALFELNMESMHYYVLTHGLTQKVRYLQLPIAKLQLFCLFNKSPKGQTLAKEFDRINREAKANGVYEGIFKEYVK